MGRLFLTGDIHQNIDIGKLTTSRFPIQKELVKDDVLIILGDVGLVWNDSETDYYWRKWFSEKNFTTFCVCGNHENYDLIEKFPIVERFGDKVREIVPSIYYATSGGRYQICGHDCLVINGADSSDKEYRTEGASWWPQEQIGQEVIDKVIKDNKPEPEFILSHTCGVEAMKFLGFPPTISDERLMQILNFYPNSKHYCGHMHVDKIIDRTRIMYDDIIEV